ncbi:hypothetical protein G6F57_019483 [Rhizopus arrhizus]|nr:hypothetical protein G6F29_013854 [Rhizopus arrhizus]KAG1006904.1 hypothetical protein G6F26_013853 [Rhizopus arrhizus]KAG1019506.1 hypothetical protein G6F25_013587 [Rhizopus arrhizus]KAG1058479.1 hypothetical protein G6F41_013934 [Rhizopus arrhizus]KAG1249866.1 hypothetical protein G6F65_018955 [Rhizopus arrhizus]
MRPFKSHPASDDMCYVRQGRLFFSNETPMGPGDVDRNRLMYGSDGYLTLSAGRAETEMKAEVKGSQKGPYPNA